MIASATAAGGKLIFPVSRDSIASRIHTGSASKLTYAEGMQDDGGEKIGI